MGRAAVLAAWLAVIALAFAPACCRSAGEPAAAAGASTRLIVRYKDEGISSADARASVAGLAAAALGGGDVSAAAASAGAVSSMRRVGGARGARRQQFMRGTFVVDAASADAAAALLAAAKSDPGVAWAEPDTVRHAFFLPSECAAGGGARCRDTPDSRYWHVLAAELDRAWSARGDSGGLGGARVQGAVIDTGVMLSHTELAGVMDVAKSTDCSGPALPCSGSGADDNGHGTHCAGIMAARHNNGPGTPVGVLSSASIVSCKFLDRWGSGYTSDALECVDNLLAKGNVGVLSNSWGGSDPSDALRDALKAACAKDVLVVVAAGNDGLDVRDVSAPTYPAALVGQPGLECLLAVAATDASGRLADFSNYGAAVEIAAPGSDIFSTYFSAVSNSATAVLSGTSMATPLVAALGLALRNMHPSLTARQVKQALVRSGSVTPKGPYIAGKLVNASALFSALIESSTGPATACTPGGCPSATPVCLPSGSCVMCAKAADCSVPAGNPCQMATCDGGTCRLAPSPASTDCTMPGGQRGSCDGAGTTCLGCTRNTQCTLPAGMDAVCNVATCNTTAGACGVAPAPAGRTCTRPGGLPGLCSSKGSCIGCLADGDCALPAGADSTCAKPMCDKLTGQCTVAAAASPARSCIIASSGVPGFCLGAACVACTADAHCSLPAGVGTCSSAVCDVAAGRCRVVPAPVNVTCDLPGGGGAAGYCDGQGVCKACVLDAHCALGAGLHAGCAAPVCNRTSGQCAAARPLPAASTCTLPDSNSTAVCNGQGRCVECLVGLPTGCTLPAGQSRACTEAPVCNASSNTCVFAPLPANTTCRFNATMAPGKCNGRGGCSECLVAADCSRKVPAGWASTCTMRSCVAGACSFARAPVGQACSVAGWPGKCDAASQCRSCSANLGGSCRRDSACCVGRCVLSGGTTGTCQAS